MNSAPQDAKRELVYMLFLELNKYNTSTHCQCMYHILYVAVQIQMIWFLWRNHEIVIVFGACMWIVCTVLHNKCTIRFGILYKVEISMFALFQQPYVDKIPFLNVGVSIQCVFSTRKHRFVFYCCCYFFYLQEQNKAAKKLLFWKIVERFEYHLIR